MTTLVFIPGLVSDAFVWRAAIAAVGDLPCVVADVTTQPGIPDMARDLLARHQGRLVLVGHSMGGRVAMEMARMAPGRIAGMALLNTGTHPPRAGEADKRQAMIDLAHTAGMAAMAAVWLPGMMRPDADPDLAAELTAMVCRATPEIHERQLRALLSRPDAAASLTYKGPMLLVTGRQDAWSPIAQHQDIARICPQARLEVVENAGHFAPVEQAATVAALLGAWARDVAVVDAGLDRIPQTPLFDRPRSTAGYALNKMAMGLATPEGRAAFRADEQAYLDRFALTAEQRAAVLARDWAEMVRLGGNLFYILKISAVDPTPIRDIGAAQAGLSLDTFLETRLGKVTNG
ncbi:MULTISPECIES: alpha/beta fold hydrolase [unclassified Yoonia]|uniref:alpha/beta fold hydrolase n=1 Tax=unclassified Yoonia TaxID=2629118 RepID=UPI002AFFE4E1|nr:MULTISPECIES: alpha/beta fold hydrolase [unclassified Yoonia]